MPVYSSKLLAQHTPLQQTPILLMQVQDHPGFCSTTTTTCSMQISRIEPQSQVIECVPDACAMC
eukprot:scaffold52823_cov21-Tisochrysis_lutea.AAC.1